MNSLDLCKELIKNPYDFNKAIKLIKVVKDLTSFEAITLIDSVLPLINNNDRLLEAFTIYLYYGYDRDSNMMGFVLDLCTAEGHDKLRGILRNDILPIENNITIMGRAFLICKLLDHLIYDEFESYYKDREEESRNHFDNLGYEIERIIKDHNKTEIIILIEAFKYASMNNILLLSEVDAATKLYNEAINKEIISYFKSLKGDNQRELLKSSSLPEECIENLSLDDLFSLYLSGNLSLSGFNRIGALFLNNPQADNIKFLEALIRTVPENSYYFYYPKNEILKLSRTLPESKLLEAYINKDYSHFSMDLANINIEDALRADIKNFQLYFDVSYKLKLNKRTKEIAETFILADKNKNIVIEYTFTRNNLGTPKLIYSENKVNLVDRRDKDNAYYKWLYAYITECVPSYRSEYKSYKDKLDYEISSIKLKGIVAKIDKIGNDALLEIKSTLASKVIMEYTMDEAFSSFTMRVGNEKRMYTISHPDKFIEAFSYNEFIRYGKDLAFYHTYNNLSPWDKNIISALAKYRITIRGKNVVVNKYIMEEILGYLKGHTIILNEKEYELSLEERDIRLAIDEGYHMSVTGINGEKFIAFNDEVLVIDSINLKIDYLKRELQSLLELGLSANGVSLLPIIDEFNEKLLPHFKEYIDINPLVSDKVRCNSVEIDTYFDMNDFGRISCTVDYKKGDVSYNIAALSGLDKITAEGYLETLFSLGFNSDGIMENDEDIIAFLGLDLEGLKKLSNIYLSDTLMNKRITAFQAPVIKMIYDDDMMRVFMKESIYTEEELREILQAIKRKKKFVLLKGDRIIDLNNPEGEEFLDAINDFQMDINDLSKEVKRPLYESLLTLKYNNIERDEGLKALASDIRSFKEKKFPLPRLKYKLREYQEEAYSWLRILSGYKIGGILADDMGLGKTLEIIALLSGDESEKPSLIACPKSLIFNWVSEFNKFQDFMDVRIIYGTAEQRALAIKEISPNRRVVYISSYDSVRNDIDKYKVEFNYFIIDEAQYIKNKNAMTSQAIKRVRALNRFALTGTPIENDIFDLWSIFDFLMPGYLPGIQKFKDNCNNKSFQEAIKRLVSPFILRRTKEAVLTELPPKFERVISAEMTPEQRALYDAHCLHARDILNAGGKSFDVLHLLTRLRQICVDPKTFIDNYIGKSGKIEMLKEIINDYVGNGHRILIFSQFVKALNIVADYLNELELPFSMITGDTPGHERVSLVSDFNKNDRIKVFLISLKAGGNGLNLIGADTVIHLDPWWNLASENQATDRAYRMGQTKNVEVIRLIVSDSIEQRVVELQYKKKDLIDRLISNDTLALEHISIDDMKFILD